MNPFAARMSNLPRLTTVFPEPLVIQIRLPFLKWIVTPVKDRVAIVNPVLMDRGHTGVLGRNVKFAGQSAGVACIGKKPGNKNLV